MMRLALQAALLAAIALLVTDAALYRTNTLHANGRWKSAKLELEQGVIGAVATLVTRAPLATNGLDLGAYHGFQELWLDESRPVRELEFSFRADAPAYLDVLFGPDRQRVAGVRLSGHPEFQSLRFDTAAGGEFLEREPLSLRSRLETGRWIRVELRFGAESVELRVDGEAAASLPAAPVQALGFRGSAAGPLLDDVAVRFDAGPALLEDFANRRGRLPLFAAVATGLVALAALGRALLQRWRGLDARRAQLAVLTGCGVTLVCVAMFAALDRVYLSRLYPHDYPALSAHGYPNRIEALGRATQRIAREIAALPRDASFRILLIGSSQTWGAGARRRDENWASVLERELETRGPDVAVVDAGISGLRAAQLLELFRRDWQRMEPDLVVVDLGHNDAANREFSGALEGFAGECRQRGTQLVLVLEPNSSEVGTQIEERHALMRRVAGEQRIPVVDMHAYLAERRESGHLWWDRVHLTSYGQRLFGKQLARELEPYLERRRASQRNEAPAARPAPTPGSGRQPIPRMSSDASAPPCRRYADA